MDKIVINLQTIYHNKKNSINLDMEQKNYIFDIHDYDVLGRDLVFSDMEYTITLEHIERDIQDIKFYINDFFVKTYYDKYTHQISIIKNKKIDKRVFIDYFGYVQLSLDIKYSDGSKEILKSRYIRVMIKNNYISQSIRKMAEYVYSNQNTIISNNNMRSMDKSSLKNNSIKSIESQRKIIQDIISMYESNFNYFKQNSKFSFVDNESIDRFEKLRNVTSNTINYIVQNPDELYQTNGKGININGKIYIPNRTLITNTNKHYNIYENQVIVSFLLYLLKIIEKIIKEINDNLYDIQKSDKKINDIFSDYILSSEIIYGIARKKMENFSEDLLQYKNKISYLYRQYSSALKVDIVEINYIPSPTHTFMNIKSYRCIYDCIVKWFNHGVYEFANESFLVPFLINNQLYECYVLLRMINYFSSRYELLNKISYRYPMYNNDNIKYVNKNKRIHNLSNTYFFANQQKNIEITLYYQPIIYDKIINVQNGLSILRNNNISINETDGEGHHYNPDYIIKFKIDNNVKFLILDAKFSTNRNTKKYYLPDLVFKYLFSISSINLKDEISGLCAFSGKCNRLGIESIYNNNEFNKNNETDICIKPYTDIVTISEFENETNIISNRDYDKIFDELFSKYIY